MGELTGARLLAASCLSLVLALAVGSTAQASPSFQVTSHVDGAGELHTDEPSPVTLALDAQLTPGAGDTTIKPMAEVNFGIPDISFDPGATPSCSLISEVNANFTTETAQTMCGSSRVGTGTADLYLVGYFRPDLLIADGVLSIFYAGPDGAGNPSFGIHYYSASVNTGLFIKATYKNGGLQLLIPRITADSTISKVHLDFTSAAQAQCSTGNWVTSGSAFLVYRDDAGNQTNGENISSPTSAQACSGTPSVPDVLTVTKAGIGSGTVTSSPAGIDCGSDCQETFPHNSVVTLTASAAEGSSLSGWTGPCEGQSATCAVTMSAAKQVTASFQKTPPTGPVGVSINAGAQYTNDPDVSLSVVWNVGDVAATIANDGGFREGQDFEVAPEIDWKLDSSGPERLPKTVYLRFGDSTQTFTDDIILDETAPTLSSATASETGGSSSSVRSLASASGGHKVKLKTKASDRTSGVALIQAGPKKSTKLKKIKYRRSVTVSSSGKKLWVRVLDRAGNASKWKKVKVK